MKILFLLDENDENEVIDPNDPIGDITIISNHAQLSVKSTYLDSWFNVLIEGYNNLQEQNKITLEIFEEPDLITFEPVINGFKIAYGRQELFFSNLDEFCQSLLTAVKEFIAQLERENSHLSHLPLLIKLYKFKEQSAIT
jgi:hypothetical protein